MKKAASAFILMGLPALLLAQDALTQAVVQNGEAIFSNKSMLEIITILLVISIGTTLVLICKELAPVIFKSHFASNRQIIEKIEGLEKFATDFNGQLADVKSHIIENRIGQLRQNILNSAISDFERMEDLNEYIAYGGNSSTREAGIELIIKTKENRNSWDYIVRKHPHKESEDWCQTITWINKQIM